MNSVSADQRERKREKERERGIDDKEQMSATLGFQDVHEEREKTAIEGLYLL